MTYHNDCESCEQFKIRKLTNSSDDDVEQIRKYKEPNDSIFEEFKEHLSKRETEEFIPRYASLETTTHTKDEFNLINYFQKDGSTIFAKHKTIGKYFAIKVIPKKDLISANRVNEARNEKWIAEAIRFPFVAHLEFTFKDDLNIYFVYPYSSAEDLFTYMRRVKRIKERDAKFYGAQIVLALEYLHKLDIIYRNLKPENILFMANGYVKISDFRFIKFTNLRTYSLCGTPEYMAPEMIICKGYNKSVDWWSFGVLLYEMIAGFTPFHALDPMKTFGKIVKGRIRFTRKFSKICKNLIWNILQRDTSKRYGNLLNGSLDIKCHDWFEVIDWQKLYHQISHPPYYPEDPMPFTNAPPEKLEVVRSIEFTAENVEEDFEEF